MGEYPRKIEMEEGAEKIVSIYQLLTQGMSQFGATRTGNHIKFDVNYGSNKVLAQERCNSLKAQGIEYRYDESGNWVYVDLDTTPEAIAEVQSKSLPYLLLIDVGH